MEPLRRLSSVLSTSLGVLVVANAIALAASKISIKYAPEYGFVYANEYGFAGQQSLMVKAFGRQDHESLEEKLADLYGRVHSSKVDPSTRPWGQVRPAVEEGERLESRPEKIVPEMREIIGRVPR